MEKKKHLLCVAGVDFSTKEYCLKFARSVAWAIGGNHIGLIRGKKKGWRFKIYYVEGKPRIK